MTHPSPEEPTSASPHSGQQPTEPTGPTGQPYQAGQPYQPGAADPTGQPQAGPWQPGQQGQWQPGQPYAGGPAHPPPYYGSYAAPHNTYAILSLVLAIAVFPPLGIYFGRKAKEQIARTGERGGELATVGIVLGWIFTVFMVVFVLLWCGFVGLAVNGSST